MSPTQIQFKFIAIAAIAAALLFVSSIAVGRAQGLSQNLVASSPLSLTMEQRHIIKEVIKELKVQNEPKDIPIKVGQVIPNTVLLQAMPLDISNKVSQVKSHLFFIKNQQFVLVDQKDNKVVDVIDLR